jgi:RNA polymerase sigma-70 factor (ECF subfamily)
MLGMLPLPDPAITDEALLAAHLAGDPDAFRVLWDRHHAALLGYATRILGARTEAEEVTHEAFLRAASGRWRPDGRLRAWLFTVVHRQCLDALRRRRRFTAVVARLWSTPTRDPVDAVLRDEAEAALERALAALPEEHRAIVLLYYGQELPSKEVAEIVGCTDLQVRSRLSYARRLLRRLLAEEDP